MRLLCASRVLTCAILLMVPSALAPTVEGQNQAVRQPSPPGAAAAGTVAYDFRVLDADNQPIVDLKPEEVSLKVNGRAREIRSLALHRAKAARAQPVMGARPAAAVRPPEPFASNYPSGPGREVLLVVDDESFGSGRGRFLRPAVGNLLANLADEDRVGLVTIPRGGVNIGPTDRHETIETELAATIGRAGRVDSATDATCRALLTLGALQSVFDGLAGAPHTTVVFFSGGLVAANTEISVKTGPTGETCELRTENFRETAAAAHQVPIDFHVAVIPEDSVSGAASAMNPLAGLENLAGVTGNALIRLSGESEDQMTRLADETAAYYVATFEPDASERTGAAYRVDLKVTREGARTRARDAVAIDKDASSGKTRKGPSVKDLLRVSTLSRELPLRTTAFAAREAGSDKLKLVALFEPRDPSFTISSAAVALFDSTGKLTAQWTAQDADLKRTPVVGGLLVKPGTYRMRVAAIDAAGRRGTVDMNTTVELVGAGMSSLSALVLGTRDGSGFSPKLLFGAADPAVFGYVEVYNVAKDAALGASFELASSADGPATVTVPAALSPASQGDMRVLMAVIPLATVPPGDFVMRANVSVDGQPAGRVVRTLRKASQ